MRKNRFSNRLLVSLLASVTVYSAPAFGQGTGTSTQGLGGTSTGGFTGTVSTLGIPGLPTPPTTGNPGGSTSGSGGFGTFAGAGHFNSSGGTGQFNTGVFGFSSGASSGTALGNAGTASFSNLAGVTFSSSLAILPVTITPVDANASTLSVGTLAGTSPRAKGPKIASNTSLAEITKINAVLAGLPVNSTDDENGGTKTFEDLATNIDSSYSIKSSKPVVVTSMASPPDYNSDNGQNLTLTVQFTPGADPAPELMYSDPETGNVVPVKGQMKMDAEHGVMEVSLNAASVPSTSRLFSFCPQPLLIASLPAETKDTPDGYVAMSNDSTLLPGYLAEVKHNEVFIINRLASGFYYAMDPSLLSSGTVAPGVVTVCDSGALVNELGDQVSVLNGRSLFMVSRDNFSVRAPGAEVQMPSDSAVLVEYTKETSRVKVSLVSQQGDSATSITTPVGRPLYIKTGKSISIYQELPMLKRLKLFSAAHEEMPMKAMLSRIDDFDVADLPRTEIGDRFGRVVKRAITQPVADADRIVRCGFALNSPVRVLAADRTIFSIDKNVLSLQTGDVFLHTAGRMNVKTDVAELNTKALSDLAVSFQPGHERVDVLSGPGLVTMAVHGKRCLLGPGQEVIASTQQLSQKMLFPPDGIARRSFGTSNAGETYFSICEFAIGSLLKNSPYLKCLRQPHNSIDGLLRERLLKTACVVTFVTSSRGQYYSR